MDSNKLFIIAFIVSAAILLVPVLMRFGKKSATPAFADIAPRREPGSPAAKIASGNPAPAQAPGVPDVRVAHGKQTPLDSFIACLDEALDSHYRDWVEPLVSAADGTTFILHAVTAEMTATNLPLLEPASHLKPALLKRVFEDRLAKSAGHAHYDRAKFYGVVFRSGSEAKPTDGDVIRVLKAHGGERIEITLVFHGEPDYRAPRATQLRDTSTEFRFKPSPSGTEPSAIATLEVTLPGAATRTIAITHTPFRIGADPAADLAVDSPFLSGTHAVLDACTGGGFTLADKSRNGTWLNGVRLAAGTPVRLNARGLILLSSAVPGADVPLIEYRSNAVAPAAPEITPHATADAGIATVTKAANPVSRAASNFHASTETVFASEATPTIAAPLKAQARLRAILADGSEAEYLLTELDREIGREPGEHGIVAPASARHISRHHLRMVD